MWSFKNHDRKQSLIAYGRLPLFTAHLSEKSLNKHKNKQTYTGDLIQLLVGRIPSLTGAEVITTERYEDEYPRFNLAFLKCSEVSYESSESLRKTGIGDT